MNQSASPKNRILANLPASDYERVLPWLTPVELTHSQVLFKSGDVVNHVYFPESSMISLIATTVSGQSVEVGVVGYEGMAGVSAVLGADKSAHEALVQYPDGAMRMTVTALRAEFNRPGPFQRGVLRYVQGLLMHTSQIAACNRLHSISERLARWLLMSHDRCQCDDLPFTQEFLSLMLGTHRPSVTEAAVILQAEGSIRYRRGNITILDRECLLDHTCECYITIKEEFDRLTELDSQVSGASWR